MKKILSILLFTISFMGMAQDIKSEFTFLESEVYKDSRMVDEIVAMHTYEGNIATLRTSNRFFLVDIFDASMNRIHQEVIKKPREETFEAFAPVGRELKFFTRQNWQNSSKETIHSYAFDIFTKTYTKEELLNSDFKSRSEKLIPKERARIVKFAVSPNQKYLAIATNDYAYYRNSFAIHVYDTSSLKLVYSNSYREQTERSYQISDFKVMNDATVYTLGTSHDGTESDLRKNKAVYDYVLYKVTKDNSIYKKIELAGKKIHSLTIVEKETELLLLGFNGGNSKFRIKSLYNFIVNKEDLHIKSQKATALPKQLRQDILGKESVEMSDENDFQNYVLYQVLEDTKGNTYMVLHNVQEDELMTSPASTTREVKRYEFAYLQDEIHPSLDIHFRDDFFYQNIIAFKFDSQGELLWGRGILKAIQSLRQYAFLKNDQLHIFQNGQCEMKTTDDGRKKILGSALKKQCLYKMVFNANGEFDYHKIALRETEGRYYRTDHGFYADGMFVIPKHNLKKKTFIKFY